MLVERSHTPTSLLFPATLSRCSVRGLRGHAQHQQRRTSRLYLTEVAVRSDCRRKGVGRVLLGLVDDVAKQLKTSEVGGRVWLWGGWLQKDFKARPFILSCVPLRSIGIVHRRWKRGWEACLLGVRLFLTHRFCLGGNEERDPGG